MSLAGRNQHLNTQEDGKKQTDKQPENRCKAANCITLLRAGETVMLQHSEKSLTTEILYLKREPWLFT